MQMEASPQGGEGFPEVVGAGGELPEGTGVEPVAMVRIASPPLKHVGPEIRAVFWKPPRGMKGNKVCVYLWQRKRETLKMTKYVELVIVADNREVRAF